MGRTIPVFVAHAAEDAELAQRLCGHLAPLVRKRTADLWHPGLLRAGDDVEAVTREKLEDAELALFLVSMELLGDAAADERLRLAHRRHQEGRLHLLVVRARDCVLDLEDLPGIRPLLGGGAMSALADVDRACREVVEALRLILDAIAGQPAFGVHPTLRRVATEAFRLNRVRQWELVEQSCKSRQHCLFLLHGRRGQAVSLFAERVCRQLQQRGPHAVLTVPVRNRVANAADIENKLRAVLMAALATEAADVAVLLQRLARRAPLFLVLGGCRTPASVRRGYRP